MPVDVPPSADPTVDSLTTFLSVNVDSPALETQAVTKINELNAIVIGLAEDPWIKTQILNISRFIHSNPADLGNGAESDVLSNEEMQERIERGCDLVYAYFYNKYRAHLASVELVYPGYTERFFDAFRGHVNCLVTSSLVLLERGITLRTARDAVSASALEVLERLQLSYNNQKWNGAYNRKGFDHYSAQALNLALRRKAHAEKRNRGGAEEHERVVDYSFSQIYIDLDKFKDVNDLYGESVGDQVLQHVLTLILRTKRSVDIFGMPSGDEYVLFLPDTDEQGAFRFAERLSTMLTYQPPVIRTRDGRQVVLDGRDGRLRVGLSIGIYGRVLNGVSSGTEDRDVAVRGLLMELHKKSELAMKGAKYLNRDTTFEGNIVNGNVMLPYSAVFGREREIEALVRLASVRRSMSRVRHDEKNDV